MPATVPCPQCARNLGILNALPGQLCRCPSCNHVFRLTSETFQPGPIIAAAPTAQEPVTAVLSATSREWTPSGIETDEPNEFANFQSEGRVVPTPPRTFHLLYRWLVIVAALQFLAGGVVFAVTAGLDQRPSGQTISSGYLNVGGKTIYFQDLSDNQAAILLPAFALLILATIAETVLFFVLLYKCWALIQDGHPQTTPGKAVGFWFIPLFNLYWIFVAVRGLAEDLNRYALRRNLPIRRASVGLATFYCVVKLCSTIPVRIGPMNSLVGYAAIPALLLELIVMCQIKNAAADIAAAKAAAENKIKMPLLL